jgi:hypothetical protein
VKEAQLRCKAGAKKKLRYQKHPWCPNFFLYKPSILLRKEEASKKQNTTEINQLRKLDI